MNFLEIIDHYFVLKISCYILAFLFAIIGHEIMHGLVAKYYGDMRAQLEGRLSINPLKHIDLVGSILLPLMLFIAQAPFLFGWAKPVPINMHGIIQRHGYMPAVYVSLAGIFYNLTLALLASTLLHFVFVDTGGLWEAYLAYFLFELVIFNVVLGIFNLFPIPPLDGSNALTFLSLHFGYEGIMRFFARIQNFGILILLVILATPLSGIFFYPIKFLIKFLLS